MVSICGFVCAALIVSASEREDFAQVQRQTQTYQAELKQTVRLRGLKKPVESTGKISYAAPDKLRVQFTQPAGEYLLITGDDVYSKKSNRPLRRSNDPNALMLLRLFQGNVRQWEEKFEVVHVRKDDRLVVTLRNGQVEIENQILLPAYDIRSIQIRFNDESRAAGETPRGQGGNSLTYEFSAPVRDAPLDDKLFEVSEFDRKL